MININIDNPITNSTVIKFGGWDQSAMQIKGTHTFYNKTFNTIPGTWTL